MAETPTTYTYTTKQIVDGVLVAPLRKDGPLQTSRYERLLAETHAHLEQIAGNAEITQLDRDQRAISIARAFGCGEHYQGERRLCLKHRCPCREDAMAMLIADRATRGLIGRLNREATNNVSFKIKEP